MASDSSVPATTPSGQVARQEFGASEVAMPAETSSSAVAAQAKAAVEARYVMAMRNPRDWDDVRTRLLKECKRSGFARVALYHKPIGKGVEGLSIRFAEAALRCMTNVYVDVSTVYDDTQKRIVRVSVTDLESNITYPKDVVVSKTVERKQLRKGQTPIGSRTNSYGERVYLVEATDDDILNKENALVSKAMRTNGLRLIPGDIMDEAEKMIREVRAQEVESDPNAERKRIADAFADLGVKPSEIKGYLGTDLGGASPAQLIELRALWEAIHDGEATWAEAMDSKSEDGDEKARKAKQDALAGKLSKKRKEQEERAAAKSASDEPPPKPAA